MCNFDLFNHRYYILVIMDLYQEPFVNPAYQYILAFQKLSSFLLVNPYSITSVLNDEGKIVKLEKRKRTWKMVHMHHYY